MEPTIEIRKYPNRRYYNTRDSRHVTLEEIRDLVRDGHNIKVVDSRTEEDITVAVLTQILLEIESPKLAFFPSTFLEHLIRTNSDMLKVMTESYFNNSLAAFMRPPTMAREGAAGPFGVPFSSAMEDWQRMWFPTPPKEQSSQPAGPQPEKEKTDGADARVEELSKQVEELRRTLEQLQKKSKR